MSQMLWPLSDPAVNGPLTATMESVQSTRGWFVFDAADIEECGLELLWKAATRIRRVQ